MIRLYLIFSLLAIGTIALLAYIKTKVPREKRENPWKYKEKIHYFSSIFGSLALLSSLLTIIALSFQLIYIIDILFLLIAIFASYKGLIYIRNKNSLLALFHFSIPMFLLTWIGSSEDIFLIIFLLLSLIAIISQRN